MAANKELVYKIIADLKQFNDAIIKAEQKITAFGKKLETTGKALTIGLTAPILAVGGAMLKFAADAEVMERKFNTAFAGVEDDANSLADALNDSYGLARTEAVRLLATTGDLLKGFGATSGEALNTSNKVQQLAAALSAYNGVPVAEASNKITKALLGETDGMKTLGVAISAAAVEAYLLERGQNNLTGSALQLAKSEAVLAIAYSQSSDAVNSLSRNQDTAAFQTAALIADVKDLAATFGEIMLPVLKDVVAAARDFLARLDALSEEQKRNILVIGGLVAAIGPLLLVVGKAVVLVPQLAKGIDAIGAASKTALGPIAVAVAALTGLIALGDKIGDIQATKAADELVTSLGSVTESIGASQEQLGLFSAHFGELITGTNKKQFFTLAAYFDDVAESTGLSVVQVAKLAQASGRLPVLWRAGTAEIIANEASRQQAIAGTTQRVEQLEDAQRRIAAARTENARLELIAAAAAEARAASAAVLGVALGEAISATIKGEADIQRLVANRIITQEDANQQLLALYNAEQVALSGLGYGIEQTGRQGSARLRELEERVAALNVVTEDGTIAQEAYNTALARTHENQLADFAVINDLIVAEIEAGAAADRQATERHQKRLQEAKDESDLVLSLATQVAAAVSDLSNAITDARIANIEAVYAKEKKREDNLVLAMKNVAELDGEVTAEELANIESVKVADRKKNQLIAIAKQEQAKLDKAIALFNIGISTASGIAEALPNLLLAGIIGGIGLLQASAVLVKPLPPIPSFAQGGSFMVPPGFPNDNYPMLVQSGERVTVETPEQQAAPTRGPVVFQLGTIIADPSGLRELDRLLRKYGDIETLRRGE